MAEFIHYILTAFSLVFVIEGLIYALFPDGARKLMAQALIMPVRQLRLFGLVMVVTGFCCVWLLAAL